MKIEKLRSKLKKAFNRAMGVLLPVATLFVSCGTNALVVHAAESSVLHFVSQYYDYKNNIGEKDEVNITVPAGTEICGVITKMVRGDDDLYNELALYTVGYGSYSLNGNKWGRISSIPGYEVICTSIKDGKEGNIFTGNTTTFKYQGLNSEYIVNFSFLSGNIKVFDSLDEMKNYISTGTGDYDIIKPDTIDDGVKDPDIGYLHNLQRNSLQSGKQDENGIYEKYSARFTWDDTYPEYDSSYLVEVKGKCVVQTRGFLGFGKTKTYTSDIENIAKDISYNDLEWIISNTDQYAPFNSFINEHMPTNLVMTGVYGMRDYYFRIYKWSDTDECYHYGSWVNMHYIDDDLWISNVQESTVGDFDDNGNFIVNPDSDYGTGTKKSDGVGVGDTEEDAKKDNDRREEEKKNDDGKLDLSNASISDIWYWFVTSLSNLYNSLGFIPEFFQKIFSFLPTPIYVFLGIGIVVAILLRVLGR